MPAGRPTKLTAATTEAICRTVRAGSPPPWAARRSGVDDSTLRRWRMTATRAEAKKHNERSQHERRCIEFFTELGLAEADSFVLLSGMIQSGAQKSSLVETTTTTTQTEGEDGKSVTTTVRKEREIAGDWRAAAHLAGRRFPKDMGDRLQIEGTEGGAPIRLVTNEEAWEELEAWRRQKALSNGTAPLGAGPERVPANGHG